MMTPFLDGLLECLTFLSIVCATVMATLLLGL